MGSSDPKPRFVFQFYETSFKHIMRTVKDNVCDFSIHIFEFIWMQMRVRWDAVH
jgi:hypothetical protein